jgi:hypothetical protein
MSEVTDLDFFYGGAIAISGPSTQLLMHPVYPYFSPDFSYVDDLVGFVVAFCLGIASPTSSPRVSTAWWLFFDTCVPLHLPARWPRRHLPGEGDPTSYDYMEVDTEFAPFMQHNFPTPASTASMISVSSF